MGKLIIIAAVSLDGVIGNGMEMPWRIPEDFKHYRETTMGHTLACGSKTFKSLPAKAHEGRNFIILTTKPDQTLDETKYLQVTNMYDLLRVVKKCVHDVYVIGGESIYKQLLEHCDEAIITWVHEMFKGKDDKFFPITELLFTFEDEEIIASNIESVSGLNFEIVKYFKNNKK